MKKIFIIFCIPTLLLSCSKEIDYPPEFDLVVGNWEAYEYENIDYHDGLSSTITNHPTDSIDLEYSVNISNRRIEIYNSQTKSTVLHIKQIDIVVETAELVNFRVITYAYPDSQNFEYTIVYRKNTDDLQVESCELNSPNGSVDYCDIFKLKRKV